MIKINHLSKKFGNLEVLKDINLDIEEGEVVCIIGPSGSGKSTFLRCINQLEMPTGGTVQYEGRDLLVKIVISVNSVKRSVWYFKSLICFH